METFETYITDKLILNLLISARVKKANLLYKEQILSNLCIDGKKNIDIKSILYQIFPPRRKWVNVGFNKRIKNKSSISTYKKNCLSLKYTIDKYKKSNRNEVWMIKLQNFIEYIRDFILSSKSKIDPPMIIPKQKKELVYRPICSYDIANKIKICITNRYLTEIFDSFFYSKSYAFRATITTKDNKKITLTHHDAIRDIKLFIQSQKSKLYVAECDIKKFYDTVNHSIIKKLSKKLFGAASKKYGIDLSCPQRIFHDYLDHYTFRNNIINCNENVKVKMRDGGYFEWVEKDLKQLYKQYKNAKIGVPQGGALSGLIANIVLDYVDNEVNKNSDNKTLYLRFCDDMVLIHPQKGKCKKILYAYQEALKKVKLIPHSIEHKGLTTKEHWTSKSKGPYLWSECANAFPWISFVGYEINRTGIIRVRKESIKKEIRKQAEKCYEVQRIIEGRNLKSKHYILESLKNRLIGMSVGRVKIFNYKEKNNEMCWTCGFPEINYNPYTVKQMRLLDKCRKKNVMKLKKVLNKLDKNIFVDTAGNRYMILDYGMPFSYFFHAIKKKQEINYQIVFNN